MNTIIAHLRTADKKLLTIFFVRLCTGPSLILIATLASEPLQTLLVRVVMSVYFATNVLLFVSLRRHRERADTILLLANVLVFAMVLLDVQNGYVIAAALALWLIGSIVPSLKGKRIA